MVPEKRSCFRELLIEIGEEQEVMYHCPDGDAKLIFPEYFEEAVENTPARTSSQRRTEVGCGIEIVS